MNVLMLASDSCGPCRIVKPLLIDACEALDIPVEITHITGANDPLVLKYSVRAVPTVLLRDGDQVLKSFTGVKTKEQIEAFLTEGNNV